MVAAASESPPLYSGVLKKWTNYVNGWQDRYFEIAAGNIQYYKSKAEKCFGCRGSLALRSVAATPHEFNECDFTVSVGTDVVWYLRAENVCAKEAWIRHIVNEGKSQNDSDYGSHTKTHSRNTSSVSSVYLSDRLEKNNKLFDSRLAELEAYRTMCCDQMASLLRIIELQDGVDQTATLSIKATHLAMLNNINHIIELIKTGKAVIPDPETPARPMSVEDGEVTVREGGYASTVDVTSEFGDVWHDADEHSSLGSLDQAEEARGSVSPPPSSTMTTPEKENQPKQEIICRNLPFGHYDDILVPKQHNLMMVIDQLAKEQLKYALAGVEDNIWQLFAEDGAMRMYTREQQDEGGLPVDPLKAVHQVQGVSALEFMHYFFDAKYKKEWDHTLNDMSVVEEISPDAVVLHQKHKTVWPAAPRESLFVSHIRRVQEMKRPHAHDLYIVCNKDIKRTDIPLGSSSSVRVGLTVSMICETVILNKAKTLDQLTRADVRCDIIYVSQVHPGGWVPTAALRHVYKKEYPKFLRTFTDYVVKNITGKDLAI